MKAKGGDCMKFPETARRLQEALNDRCMTQQELANCSMVSKSSISQYINGSHTPSNLSVTKMGKVLRVNPMWLMGFDVKKETIAMEFLADSPFFKAAQRNQSEIADEMVDDMVKNRMMSEIDMRMLEMIRMYRSLSDNMKNKVFDYIIDLSKIQDYENKK